MTVARFEPRHFDLRASIRWNTQLDGVGCRFINEETEGLPFAEAPYLDNSKVGNRGILLTPSLLFFLLGALAFSLLVAGKPVILPDPARKPPLLKILATFFRPRDTLSTPVDLCTRICLLRLLSFLPALFLSLILPGSRLGSLRDEIV